LIESFLLNIPIPPIFLYENTYNQYEVMDGRQRIESIYEFLDNGFELTGLTYWPELNGMRFKELPDTIQRGLLRRTLNAIVLLTETNNIEDVDIRMILFNRLNTGGIQLNPHELRNAIYPSLFNDMLKSASRNQEFTSLWGIPPKEREEHIRPSKKLSENLLYQTMLDCELVLRYFGIKEAVEGKFKGSLRSILDKTMKAHQLDDEILVKGMEKEYINTLQILKKINGFENFIILPETNRYSRPLYDALTVACSFAISRKEIDNTIVIKDRLLHELCIPDKYEILVGRGNSLQSIKERVKLAYNIITNKVFI